MKLSRIILIFALLFSMSAFALTDEQVIKYVQTQAAAGKSEQQIGKELLAKGVTPEQVKRIKAKYERQNAAAGGVSAFDQDRDRSRNGAAESGNTPGEQAADVVLVGDDFEFSEVSKSAAVASRQATGGRRVYGRDVFTSSNLTFEPNTNMATPKNYRLGPGDEVMIDIWGESEDHLSEVISPEGSIMISQIGPVYLSGMTIDEANSHIKNLFSRKYASVGQSTDINVTLGDIRSIQVDVMGEVATPGTYRLSPFSSVFHALYNAGGINGNGSLRNIEVMRNGRRVGSIDIYDYLFKGKQSGNIRLQEGDVIIVPAYSELVNISGNVKRPMYYEMKPSETIADLLKYAGGYSGEAYNGMVKLQRRNGLENELFNIEKDQFASYKLRDGDEVTVGSVLDRYSNRVQLRGAAMRPGAYALGTDIVTVGDLVRKAEGLREDAYTERVLLYREGEDLQMEVISVNLRDILNGTAPDVALKRNDVLEIASVQEIEERGDFTISGMVSNPGNYTYADNTTLQDLIVRAGGLLQGASTARVDVSRRIVQPEAIEATSRIADIYTFSIEEGLAKDGADEFVLKPYDIVEVRQSPVYVAQGIVSIDGEVNFNGNYTLSRRNERLSDLVRRAGGVLNSAYVKGAYLTRALTDDEKAARQELIRLAMANQSSESGSDSISMTKIEVADRYNVGINLPAALAAPGSVADLVLRPGDALFVPELQSTVKVSGDVLFPNTVIYKEGMRYKDYINQAGGFGERAKKKSVYVVYMNGTVAKAGRKTPIEPGCNIVVPSKPASRDNWARTLAYISSFGSLATMAATITNLIVK